MRLSAVHKYTLTAAGILCVFCSCTVNGNRAMSRYYRNHPELRERLVRLNRFYIAEVEGARTSEEARALKAQVIEELERRGKGRFELVEDRGEADAIMSLDMKRELGPDAVATVPPFAFGPDRSLRQENYVRLVLRLPGSDRILYRTDSTEMSDFTIDSIEKAAYRVVKNLVNEIERARVKKGIR